MLFISCLLFSGALCGSGAIAISNDIEDKIRSGVYFPIIFEHISDGGEDRWLKQYFNEHRFMTWLHEDNLSFKNYKKFMDNGLTIKGLTFNVYDDSLREEAIAFFRLLKTLDIATFHLTAAWASIYVNEGILEYALRLSILYAESLNSIQIPPPFSVKPHYFFNSETIRKANHIKLRKGNFISEEAKINQYYRTNDTISINTNYSGWNLAGNGCAEKLAYFREDIGLNSFYYGIHLLYPFWMSNEELESLNPGRSEHYYYAHQQLLARYYLEIAANELNEVDTNVLSRPCDYPSYNPYLEYSNGLSFPVRYPYSPRNDVKAAAYLSSVDTIIRELASRGLLIMTNGTRLNLTADNHVELLAKLIRANVDGVKYAKTARSLYGGQGYPMDKYNPAPSVLHHPETSLRDPIFWNLLSFVMDYFNIFKVSVPPHNLTDYENQDFKILQMKTEIMETYFEYYQSNISNIIGAEFDSSNQRLLFTARQKRLAHNPLNIKFDVESKHKTFAIVRLYLGSRCENEECFSNYNNWYELETFKTYLHEGINNINWSAEHSEKYSHDDRYNLELVQDLRDSKPSYNMFKFPHRLAIPKGNPQGFNATIFIMITEDQVSNIIDYEPVEVNHLHDSVYYEIDEKPLGFPFDRYSYNYNVDAKNYKFFNVEIYHTSENSKTQSGYFSPELD